MADANQHKEASLAQSLHAHQVVLLAVATLAELRESDTESHILRVQNYVRVLAEQLHKHPGMALQMAGNFIETLCACTPLYDLGSVGVPERVLLKPGRLSADEVAIMRTHTTLGHAAIGRAEKTLGRHSPLLTLAREMTLSHHEKWNGQGYPQGLRGQDIPLSARIVALADVYDALISSKVYKPGVSHEEAVQVIFTERESHFDPDVVDAFMEIHGEFAAIAARFADTEDDMQRKIDYMAKAIAEPTAL